jgi:hypothetical protein
MDFSRFHREYVFFNKIEGVMFCILRQNLIFSKYLQHFNVYPSWNMKELIAKKYGFL